MATRRSDPELSIVLHDVVDDLDDLVGKLERAIEVFGADASGSFDLAALHRARDCARKGAELAREGLSSGSWI